jgi:glucokinase
LHLSAPIGFSRAIRNPFFYLLIEMTKLMDDNGLDLAIGVDVGATKIAAALATRDGRALATRQTPTLAQQGPGAALDRIAGEIKALIEAACGIQGARLLGVGVGTPGQVLAEQGVVRGAVNLGWEQVALVDELRSRLAGDHNTAAEPLPIWIEKDANASALGEAYYGAAQGCRDFVYLGVGSGLGGGVLTGGRLVTGADANAAEVGHLSLDPLGGLPCACGLRGCAETLASGPGLVNAYRRLAASAHIVTPLSGSRSNAGGDLRVGPDTTAADILAAARAGESLALAALDEAGRALGIVAAACVALLNPARIVIGGGLGVAAFELFEKRVRAELAVRTLPASQRELTMAPSLVQSPAMGAACLVWYAGRG